MNTFQSRARHQQGFTLTEIAIALVIVALLIGGILVPLGTQQDLRYRSDTDKALSNIRDALIAYAIVNGRLPCPANGSIATGTGTNCPGATGCEVTSGSAHTLTCTNNPGVLPWATLGLPETDGWGRRYTYRVDPIFSRGVDAAPTTSSTFGTGCSLTQTSDMPTKAAFALCTQGGLTVKSSNGTSLASAIPMIVISHGKNGLGAYLSNGQQIAGASGDEATNTGAGMTFISDTSIDDQLLWIPGNILMSRMLAAGKLP